MTYTIKGFATVEINESDIRNVYEGIEMLKGVLEQRSSYEGKEDDIKVYDELLGKIAKVAGLE